MQPKVVTKEPQTITVFSQLPSQNRFLKVERGERIKIYNLQLLESIVSIPPSQTQWGTPTSMPREAASTLLRFASGDELMLDEPMETILVLIKLS